MRRIAIGVVAVVAAVVVLVLGVYGFSARRLNSRMTIPAVDTFAIPSDSASIARGEHLVTALVNCMDCHGSDLGGTLFIDAGPMIGKIYTPNLTAGGIGATYTDADWIGALRHGVAPDGRPLMIMPSEAFTYLSDEDLADVIAYVRSRPPVERETGRSSVGPLARALFLAGKFPILSAERIDHDMPRPRAVTPGATPEYGEYLAQIGGCVSCHGADLRGGPVGGAPPDVPPAPNLTQAGIGHWSEADFVRAMRTGQRPDGRAINPFMPWRTYRNLTDDELRAIWLYLRSVPATSGAPRSSRDSAAGS